MSLASVRSKTTKPSILRHIQFNELSNDDLKRLIEEGHDVLQTRARRGKSLAQDLMEKAQKAGLSKEEYEILFK